MTVAVVTFPGSNCDRDCTYVLRDIMHGSVRSVFHKETTLGNCDAVVIPGGFSYGDYLRPGALAKHSPIMSDIMRFANEGGSVIGICNGFQVLCECGLLPGALIRNRGLRFVSRTVTIRVENNTTRFSRAFSDGQLIRMPIAHGDGCYLASEDVLKRLEVNDRVVFRYVDDKGTVSDAGNPNGSANEIAGIINDHGNVLGMMPHPERASDSLISAPDGRGLFQSFLSPSSLTAASRNE